jgi:hypothetical protein
MSTPRPPALTDGFALLIVGIVACEAAATLLIAIGRAPIVGLPFVAGGIAIAFTGLRRHRRNADTIERAGERATLDEAAARMLVELHVETNNLARAVRVAIEHVTVMKEQDLRNMIASLQAWGQPDHSAALTLAVALRRAIAAGDIRRSGSSDRLATH